MDTRINIKERYENHKRRKMGIEKLRFIAYRLYQVEKKRDILDDSIALGYESAYTLGALIRGEKKSVSLDFVRQWYKITGETEILEAMLEGTGYIPTKMVTGNNQTDIYKSLLENHDSLTDINRELARSLIDGKIDDIELVVLLKLARKNRQEAADIEESIKGMQQ